MAVVRRVALGILMQTLLTHYLPLLAGLLCLHGLASPVIAGTQEQLLVDHAGVQISFDDAYQYAIRHTNPARFAESVSRPRAALQVLENIYVLERALAAAVAAGLMPESDRDYVQQDSLRRVGLERYVEHVLNQRTAAADWAGLARERYLVRIEEFMRPEEVRATHLLVSLQDRTFDDFVSRVREVQTALAGTTDLSALAVLYSDDPTVEKNQGDLGFFNEDRMEPNFANAAFAIKDSAIVGPIMTSYGAHFIQLTDRREPLPRPFEDVKGSLIKEIKKEMGIRWREALLADFKAEIQSSLAEIDEARLKEWLLNVESPR